MKIQGQKDKDKLTAAKDISYLNGFLHGVFCIGEYSGQKVSDVKDVIKQNMIDKGEAAIYYEPEKEVISRTKDSCIVAKVDQWMLKYGEEHWKNTV